MLPAPTPRETFDAARKLFRERLADFDALLRAKIGCYAIASGTRTPQEQHRLYLIGRNPPGRRVTNADWYLSPHVWGFARDYLLIANNGKICKALDDRWALFGKLAEQCGLCWGGSFRRLVDSGHVELPAWASYINWPTPHHSAGG